jgi:type I restriction enzyme S subunit
LINKSQINQYKDTEIGKIPVDWNLSYFKDVTTFKMGRTPPRKVKKYWDDGKYLWVSISDMKDFGRIISTKESVSEEAFTEIFKGNISPKGTLLMSFKLTIGRTVILDIDAFHNEAIISIFPNEKYVSKYFLFYYLPTIKYSDYQGGAVKGNTLNKNSIERLPIPIPPIQEQNKISSILSKVDEQIRYTESIIDMTEELKKGMMQQLLTKGIGHTKFKKTEVGEIPEEWDVKKIEDIKSPEKSSIAMGPFGSNITADNFVPTGVPVIRGLNLTDVYLVESEFVYLLEDKADELSTSNAFPDDIVITHRGTIGQVSIIPQNSQYSRYVVSQSQMKLKCDKSIVVPHFVNFFLNSTKGQYLLLRNKAGSGVPAIGQPTSSLKKVPIPIPPLEEQNKIIEIIAYVYDQIADNKNYLSHLQELKKGLMQDLLTGKVRVKVE